MKKNNEWKLVLIKDDGDIVVDSFKTKVSAKEELQYRNSLCSALGYNSDASYEIRRIVT
jgi:hypothetical protein